MAAAIAASGITYRRSVVISLPNSFPLVSPYQLGRHGTSCCMLVCSSLTLAPGRAEVTGQTALPRRPCGASREGPSKRRGRRRRPGPDHEDGTRGVANDVIADAADEEAAHGAAAMAANDDEVDLLARGCLDD